MTAVSEPMDATNPSAATAEVTPGKPATTAALPRGRLRLYVWELPVRLSHWVTAGAIVVLSFTGGYIADPFLIPPGGSVMGTIRLIHMIAAFTLLLSGVVRIWSLIAGNRFARWSAFIPTSWTQFTEMFRQAAFYGFLTRRHPKVLGHNQLAAAAYVALWILLLVETVTGFALDGLIGAEPGASGFFWVRELIGVQEIRLIHHAAMWAILAIAVFHVYSCVLIDRIERNGLMSSIFSGFKYVTRDEIAEARDGGPDVSDLRVGNGEEHAQGEGHAQGEEQAEGQATGEDESRGQEPAPGQEQAPVEGRSPGGEP